MAGIEEMDGTEGRGGTEAGTVDTRGITGTIGIGFEIVAVLTLLGSDGVAVVVVDAVVVDVNVDVDGFGVMPMDADCLKFGLFRRFEVRSVGLAMLTMFE